MSETIFKIFVDDKYKMTATVNELEKQSSDWSGTVGLYDIVTFNNQKMVVSGLGLHYPDSKDDDFYVDLHLKK